MGLIIVMEQPKRMFDNFIGIIANKMINLLLSTSPSITPWNRFFFTYLWDIVYKIQMKWGRGWQISFIFAMRIWLYFFFWLFDGWDVREISFISVRTWWLSRSVYIPWYIPFWVYSITFRWWNIPRNIPRDVYASWDWMFDLTTLICFNLIIQLFLNRWTVRTLIFLFFKSFYSE